MKIASIFETFWRFTSETCLTLIGDGDSLKTISEALIFLWNYLTIFFVKNMNESFKLKATSSCFHRVLYILILYSCNMATAFKSVDESVPRV